MKISCKDWAIGAAFAGLMLMGAAQAEEVPPEALDDLPAAQIYILGEVHDNGMHHDNQARALHALAPAAVVFEMLSPGQAQMVNQAPIKDAALGAELGWEAHGWPDFALYLPVFEALGAAQIYGMDLPRDKLREVFGSPLPEVFGEDAARFGLDQPLPEDMQSAREAFQFTAHCDALPEDLLPGMVDAQRLRDAHFARITLQALAETGGPVAVITGSGHARQDWGMPAALALAAPDVTVLSIGQVEEPGQEIPPFDLWLVTAPAEREDPCAAFAKSG
ncbi:MAG: ChaN family lipoprotein [Mangrovicoccus sp.]|nr:ChaN family lipoprotein [Mangrovicoccus sp.]